ncbi:ABC transporter substrate-binding protein [Paenochrobactrum glaciei]|uniref:ABC transporter substrate-binding protein n=1 Tax=Paenochrobactrum glaciei TaxID=486407 RepID=A0ABP3RAE4_9HYPH
MYNINRRHFLALGAAFGGASLAGLPAWAAENVIELGWYPGLLGQNFKKGFLDGYPDAAKVKIIEAFDNARFTQMQANRNKPSLHLGVFTDAMLPLVARSGLIRDLSVDLIPNLADFDPLVPRPVGDKAVPLTYGSWGIAYNAKYIKEPITSWADLLRPDLAEGVSAPNITYNSSLYTLDALASLKGGSIKDPKAGFEAMRQIRLGGPGLWDQESTAVGGLKTGEIWATPYLSGSILALMSDPDLPDLRFCVPSEGAYSVPMSITRVDNDSAGNAPDDLINYMLSKEPQEAFARIGGCRPVNKNAVTPDDVAAMVPMADKLRSLDWAYFSENRTSIVDAWNDIVNG